MASGFAITNSGTNNDYNNNSNNNNNNNNISSSSSSKPPLTNSASSSQLLIVTPIINNFASNKASSVAATPLTNNTSKYKMNGSNNNNNNKKASASSSSMGQLKVTVLSAYDLTIRDPPSCVSITIGNRTAQTGPPVQRHKDRNSFKFGASLSTTNSLASMTSANQSTITNGSNRTTTANMNEVIIQAPLPELYSDVAHISLLYTGNNADYTLITDYPLNQLHINEPVWLILHLEKTAATADTGSVKSKDTHWDVPPTIRVQMTLSGPYRTEIAAIINLSNSWFRTIDEIEYHIKSTMKHMTSILPIGSNQPGKMDPKLLLISIVPIIALFLVASPVFIGVSITILPFIFPVIVAISIVAAFASVSGFVFFSSTRTGRDVIGTAIQPIMTSLLSSKAGQKLIYQTGPRPTPVHISKAILPGPNNLWGRLIVSLLIDFIGSSSYLVPILGELTDGVWAPIQTIFVMAMYDELSPNLKYVSFVEEILPFTDIIPTATMGWLMQYGVPLVLGTNNKNKNGSSSSTGIGATTSMNGFNSKLLLDGQKRT